jgi:hypothetical protein
VSDELLPRLARRHAGDPLELRAVLICAALQLHPRLMQDLVALVELGRAEVELARPLTEIVLRLRDAPLEPCDLVPAGADVLFGVSSDLAGLALGVLGRLT